MKNLINNFILEFNKEYQSELSDAYFKDVLKYLEEQE